MAATPTSSQAETAGPKLNLKIEEADTSEAMPASIM